MKFGDPDKSAVTGKESIDQKYADDPDEQAEHVAPQTGIGIREPIDNILTDRLQKRYFIFKELFFDIYYYSNKNFCFIEIHGVLIHCLMINI